MEISHSSTVADDEAGRAAIIGLALILAATPNAAIHGGICYVSRERGALIANDYGDENGEDDE